MKNIFYFVVFFSFNFCLTLSIYANVQMKTPLENTSSDTLLSDSFNPASNYDFFNHFSNRRDYAFIGNGYVGTRISRRGTGYYNITGPTPSERTYSNDTRGYNPPAQVVMTGVWDKINTSVNQNFEPGIGLPNWDALEVAVGGNGYYFYGQEDPNGAFYESYNQTIDTSNGSTTTSVIFNNVSLTFQQFSSMTDKNLSFSQVEITPLADDVGDITVIAILGEGILTPSPLLKFADIDNKTAYYSFTNNSNVAPKYIAYASNISVSNGCELKSIFSTDTQIGFNIEIDSPTKGTEYCIQKAVYITDSDTDLDSEAVISDLNSADSDFASMLNENTVFWGNIWESGIEVTVSNDRQEDFSKSIIASMYYLLSSIRAPETIEDAWSISPVGLTSNCYNNHIFWDAEIWMYPVLLAFYPDKAENILLYRMKTLNTAQSNASALGFNNSAKFAWESASTGLEETGWEPSADELHITGDVALSFGQYQNAQNYIDSTDSNLTNAEINNLYTLTANYWNNVITDSGNINGVTSVDENYNTSNISGGVNNDFYTNCIANVNLELATTFANFNPLKLKEAVMLPATENPFYNYQYCHPEFQNFYSYFSTNSNKQADVTLAYYPLGFNESDTQIAINDLTFYSLDSTLSQTEGPAMTYAISSILALNYGLESEAYNYLVTDSIGLEHNTDSSVCSTNKQNIFGPFHQYFETHNLESPGYGGANIFTTGCGAYLQIFVYGATGLRWNLNENINESDFLQLSPCLPANFTEVKVKRLLWKGRVINITVSTDNTTVELVSGNQITAECFADTANITEGSSYVFQKL